MVRYFVKNAEYSLLILTFLINLKWELANFKNVEYFKGNSISWTTIQCSLSVPVIVCQYTWIVSPEKSSYIKTNPSKVKNWWYGSVKSLALHTLYNPDPQKTHLIVLTSMALMVYQLWLLKGHLLLLLHCIAQAPTKYMMVCAGP